MFCSDLKLFIMDGKFARLKVCCATDGHVTIWLLTG